MKPPSPPRWLGMNSYVPMRCGIQLFGGGAGFTGERPLALVTCMYLLTQPSCVTKIAGFGLSV